MLYEGEVGEKGKTFHNLFAQICFLWLFKVYAWERFCEGGEKRLKLTSAFKNPFSYFVGANAWWHDANLIKCILCLSPALKGKHHLGIINCRYAISFKKCSRENLLSFNVFCKHTWKEQKAVEGAGSGTMTDFH